MKKTSMTLLSLLTCSGVVCAEPTPVSGPAQQGVYQFEQTNQLREYKLCTYEMCQLTPEGRHVTLRTSVGSVQGAIALASDEDTENYMVFYPPGKEGVDSERRVLRKRYLVELKPGASHEEVKERCGIRKMEPVFEGSKYFICEEESSGKVLNQLEIVASDHGVKRVEPLLARAVKKHLIPDDPFFTQGGVPNDPTDQLSEDSYQWYLKNEGTNGAIAGVDINVERAWDIVTGDGVLVGIVDDGVFVGDDVVAGSEDLDPNAAGPHQNFQDGAPNATLGASFNDTHGTAVAGLACAVFNENFGMAGVAPGSNFASIRLFGEGQLVDDAQTAQALNSGLDVIDIYNNSWGPGEREAILIQESDLVLEALERGVTDGRGGAGAIYVFSAGNDGDIEDNSNFSSLTSSQYTIAVGAITNVGTAASYSEPGANLVVCAPSGGGTQSVLTTTYEIGFDEDGQTIRVPTHFDSFTGTSAAAPLVSGVVALMLEANPGLGWRDVQDILIRTATKNDPDNLNWITNADGLHFHHSYGAGLVNAEEAVLEAADRTENLPARSAPISRLSFSGQVEIPEGGSVQRVIDLTDDPNLRVEHVELRLRVITDRKADLEVVLVSPSGTRSVLSPAQESNDLEQSILNYVFMTTRNWGEGSAGRWTLNISDVFDNGISARFNDATLTVHGVEDPNAPVTPGPVLIGSRTIQTDIGDSINYPIEALNFNSIAVGALPPGLVYDPVEALISGVVGEPGIYSVPITLTGDNGETTVTVSILVRPISGVLGGAVEVDLPTITGGDVPWDLEDTITLDEEDAVRSGIGMRDGESSIIGFNGIPEGVIMFDWAVSSQSFSNANTDPDTNLPVSPDDRLWFNFGGPLPQSWAAFIDGERSFGAKVFPRGTVAVPMTEASNNPRWTYKKDDDFSGGQDAGYLDQVRFIDTKSFMDNIHRAGNLNFDVEFRGKTWWLPVEISLGSEPSDGSTGPGELIRTSSVGNGQTVSMSAWLEGPGTLDYRIAVSSEVNDVYEFLVDGAPRLTLSGNISIQSPDGVRSYDIPEGLHYVEFRYRKDFTLDGGNDLVLLDDITFTPAGTMDGLAARFGVEPSDVDSDGDGYTNYEEIVFGGDPNVRDVPAYLPRFVGDEYGSYLEFGVNLELGDVSITAQQSSDLENWEESNEAVMNRRVGNVEFYRIPVGALAGEDHLYYRVIAAPK